VQFSNQNFPHGTRSLHKNKISPETQKRHSFIAQNQKFSPEKTLLFCNYSKDVESYTQMPGKRTHVLALEFSNFSGEAPPQTPRSVLRAFGARRVLFFRGCTPVPEILDPPLEIYSRLG
jgi:hypothetical protein